VKAVGWSFFGVRKNSAYQEDLGKLNPLHIIAVAFAAVIVFVVGLVLLVRFVVAPKQNPPESIERRKKARS
jgi:hypothetical protein